MAGRPACWFRGRLPRAARSRSARKECASIRATSDYPAYFQRWRGRRAEAASVSSECARVRTQLTTARTPRQQRGTARRKSLADIKKEVKMLRVGELGRPGSFPDQR